MVPSGNIVCSLVLHDRHTCTFYKNIAWSLELKDGDCGRRCLGPLLCFERNLLRCLGPLLCFERDLLDDEGVSLAGDGVFDLSADECLDLSGELSWGEDSRE